MGTEVARDGVLPLPGNVDLPNVRDQISRVRDAATDGTRSLAYARISSGGGSGNKESVVRAIYD